MPESPLELLRNGQVANLPWMTGLTSEEGFFNRYIIQIIWFLLFCLYIFRGMVYFIVIWTRQHGIFERIWSESYRGYKSSWWTIPYRHNLFKKPLNAKSKSKFVATLMCFLWELICVLFSYFFMSEY